MAEKPIQSKPTQQVTKGGSLDRCSAAGRTSIGQLFHQFKNLPGTKVPVLPAKVPVKETAQPTSPTTVQAVALEDPAERSRRVREQIWKDAEENTRWYLEQTRKDGNRKPWFHYLRKPYQYGEFIMLSEDMAKELAMFNPDNRNKTESLTAAYGRDMESDNWIPSHEGIGINLSGNMFDGQHRVDAVIEVRKPIPIWVVFNVLDEAKFVADSGKKRNVNEKLAMVCKTPLHNRTAGMVKSMMRGLKPRFKFSEAEIATFAAMHLDVITWIGKLLPGARADVQAALGKAYLWYGPEKLEKFCDRLREVQFVDDNDPAKRLYFYTNGLRTSRNNDPISTYKKTLSAIEHVINDTTCGRLYEKNDDIFEWEVDDEGHYHVPPRNVS